MITFYKILDTQTGECYIGSTKQKLISLRGTSSSHSFLTNKHQGRVSQTRLAQPNHKCKHDCTARQILERRNYIIEIIEVCDFINNQDRLIKERTSGCVNRNRPIITEEEKKQYKKEQNNQLIACNYCHQLVRRCNIRRHEKQQKCINFFI